jgi:hypothetical protein
MDFISALGYVAAISFVIYLLFHLFQTVILKKKVTTGWVGMAYFVILYVLILIYVIAKKDLPLIIIIATFLVWALLGSIDKVKKK